jgi:hypothetical protein
METDVVVIPVDAHLLTLTISTPQIVERPVRVGRETRMQRERIQRTREIQTQRSAASLTLSFMEVNKIFGAADIEFRLRNTTSESVEAPKGSEALDDGGFLMLAAGFPMNNAVSLLLVRRFAASEGAPPRRNLASARSETALPTQHLPMNSGTCSGSSTRVTYGI